MQKIALLTLTLAFAPNLSASGGVGVDVPPGWQDASESHKKPGIVLVLKGPETSSFVLSRIGALDLSNKAAIRAFLLDVLSGVNRRSGLGFSIHGGIEPCEFSNGLKADCLKADLKGRPRLALAVASIGGSPMLAVLTSSVPELIFPSILGSLKAEGEAPALLSSFDGQLAFPKLPAFSLNALSEDERVRGVVAAITGFGSELSIVRLAANKMTADRPQALRAQLAAMPGVDSATIGEPRAMNTPAGPSLIWASARLRGAGGPEECVAAYLPWGYLGYSILAKGPRAMELFTSVFEALTLGPSAQARMIAETQKISLTGRPRWLLIGIAACAAVLFILVWLSRGRPFSARKPDDVVG
jgi:hypothetical protein